MEHSSDSGKHRGKSQHRRRLFIDSGASVEDMTTEMVTASNSNSKRIQKKEIRLKQFTLFEDLHPLRKKPRLDSGNSRKVLSPKQKNDLPSSLLTEDKLPTKYSDDPSFQPEVEATRCLTGRSIVVTKRKEQQPTPSKIALMPFSGVVPKLAANCSEISDGLYYQSPDKAARRPLKRRCSEQCIKSLAELSPGPNLSFDSSATRETDETGEAGTVDDLHEPFPPCLPAVKRKRATDGNFHKLDLRHKRYSRGKQKLKGAALKRFILRNKSRSFPTK